MSWLRRGRRSRSELVLRGGFENLGTRVSMKKGAYTCPGIPAQSVLDAAGTRGYLGCVRMVGEGTGVVLPELAAGCVLVLA